jgi:galactose mutarotase-like enzyme
MLRMLQGYPGNLQATVTYILPKSTNELQMQIQAITDKPTIGKYLMPLPVS